MFIPQPAAQVSSVHIHLRARMRGPNTRVSRLIRADSIPRRPRRSVLRRQAEPCGGASRWWFGYDTRERMSTTLFIEPAFEELLRANGLADFPAFLRLPAHAPPASV